MACSKCSSSKVVPHESAPVQTGPSSVVVPTTPVVSKNAAITGTVHATSKPKSYSEIEILPDAAPTVAEIRDPAFTASLVEIEAASVIAGFCKEDEQVEEVTEDCPDCDVEISAGQCLNTKAISSVKTPGASIPNCWMDAVETPKMTLIGRLGKKIAKLVGEGVLWLDCEGKVMAIKDVPLRVGHLWHKWYKPTATSAPIIGKPMSYPYKVISDIDGNPHVVKGLCDEDSIEVWNHEEMVFEQKPASSFPTCVSDKIPSANRLELVGFEPLGIGDDPSLLRCLKKIQGEGQLVFKTVQTAPTDVCECGECSETGQVAQTTTVAEFVPNPVNCDVNCPMIWAFVNGEAQWVDASTVECLRGPAGANGLNGRDGVNGQDGTNAGEACC